jgi:hypothetical protein
VVRDATHGDIISLGECDIENSRSYFGILKKHFVEVAEAIEEKNIIGQGPAHGHILSHHRGKLFLSCHRSGLFKRAKPAGGIVKSRKAPFRRIGYQQMKSCEHEKRSCQVTFGFR